MFLLDLEMSSIFLMRMFSQEAPFSIFSYLSSLESSSEMGSGSWKSIPDSFKASENFQGLAVAMQIRGNL